MALQLDNRVRAMLLGSDAEIDPIKFFWVALCAKSVVHPVGNLALVLCPMMLQKRFFERCFVYYHRPGKHYFDRDQSNQFERWRERRGMSEDNKV